MDKSSDLKLAAALLVLLMQACGGEGDAAGAVARVQEARGQPEALFAQDGRPSRAARQPPEGWPHATRAGLYASAQQYDWEALTVEPYTVLVDVDLHASSAAAIDKTLADFRYSPDGARVAFYVRASDAAQAVAVADALADAGVPLVFLLTGRDT